MTRRGFLQTLITASVSALMPLRKASAAEEPRQLRLSNIHTGENLDITYYSAGRYIPEAVGRINHLLRCHYTDTIKAVDLRLLDLLASIREIAGRTGELTIISGYRSMEYNEYLRRAGRKVVKDSLHTQGHAIDFALEGISTRRLASIAKSFALGGVGTYPEFVHIDVGRVRYW